MTESRALGWLAVAAVALVIWLAWPFAVGLLLGTLMAFMVEPVCKWLAERSRRPRVAALVTVMVSGLILLTATSIFATQFVKHLVDFAMTVREALRPGGALASSANAATAWLTRYGVDTSSITARLEESAAEMATKSAAIAGAVATQTFGMLLGLFFALLAMYAVLRHWTRLVAWLVAVSPLQAKHTREVLEVFRRAGRATLAGTVVTGLAQGALAGIGYWIAGIPEPAFFGAATAVASLIPAVGTLIVWVPVAIFLFVTGHPTRAFIELVWCSLTVIALSDYVIRPRLVGDDETPEILTFIALFGGLELFGLSGLVVGPILMSVAVATLRLYVRETADEERPATKAAGQFR
ncbi:MAG TPA: AI-2E family transporter [Vicinamibacterales bacterium]|nr:AI-2E family transporter [Vicinamibacterales bacterium]